MELPMRKDVPVELTWDLSLLYASEEDMLADVERAKELTDAIVTAYKGNLTSAKAINDCLLENFKVQEILYVSSMYAELAVEVDYYDSHNQERQGRFATTSAELSSKLSFIDSELAQLSDDLIEEAISYARENQTGTACYLQDVLRKKPHFLSAETEKVLAQLAPVFATPYQNYNMTKLADMKFDSFEVKGKTYPLGYSLFEDDYEYEQDIDVRRAAFRAFSNKLRQYENTTAAAYNAQVTTDKLLGTVRGFDSVFDSLLFDQKVTREMYDRQIDLITEKLAPHMQKYARLLQKKHGIEKMTFADLKIALDPEFDPRITIPEAKEYCKKGLAILGEDYVAMIDKAFEERWIDFAKNQGKCTGGFCATPYGKNSYILLSWNDRMSDCLTICHELGHAGHFAHCNSTQSIADTNVSSYLVESPSTMNELLMAHYLLKTSDDKRFRRWVLSSMISHTYYHNFVTHLREAWYQREVYKIIDQGGTVNAETLSALFKKNLELFWGDAVEIDDDAALTWMRQPHYYMGLYSYTYSAGLTLATQVCKRIEAEGQPAVDDWKKVLDAGSTLDPIGLAKLAGIDLTTDAALLDTIEYIGSIIDEICEITEEIG